MVFDVGNLMNELRKFGRSFEVTERSPLVSSNLDDVVFIVAGLFPHDVRIMALYPFRQFQELID